jgi:acid phosphatase type 7
MTRSGRIALALFLAAEAAHGLAAAGQPTKLLKGPYLAGLSDTGVDVRFELDAPATATVEVTGASPAADAGAPRRFPDPTSTANHLVHVSGLEPGKSYGYAVMLGTQVLGRGTVTTAPDPASGAPVRFIVYGDSRSDATTHEGMVRAMLATPSDFLVNTGDIVGEGGSAADWQSFFSVEAPLLRDRPLFLCIGNHELYEDEAGANFARYFGFLDASGTLRPYGTVRIGDVRLFFLNGMHDWSSGEERTWLERELTKADREPGLVWRMAVIHHSPWSSGPHGPNTKLVAAHVPELLSAHKVDILFSGHDHIYERGEGSGSLKYIISGGGGAPLYRITKPMPETRQAEAAYHFVEVTATPTEVRTVAHRLDGSTLEKCGFQKGGSWDCDHVAVASTSTPPPPAPAAPVAPSRCSVGGPGTHRGAGWSLVVGFAGALAVLRRRRPVQKG